MKKLTLLFILSMAIATLANAQATRTWISGVGDDVNPCSRTAPCKTFAGAISKTAVGGIINCLDPGGFGAVTITKAITFDCTNSMGSVLSSGVQGIIINTTSNPNASVVLRGLDINGAGVTLGTNGVNIITAGQVSLFNVRIANYSGSGLVTTNTTGQLAVFLDSCQILNTNTGIFSNSTGSGSTLLTVNNSQILDNVTGIDIEGPGNNSAQIFRANIARNSADGFKLGSATSGAAIGSSSFSFNGNGVNAVNFGSTVRLSDNLIQANFTNGVTGLGTTKCFSNNIITGNIGSNACSSPSNAMQ